MTTVDLGHDALDDIFAALRDAGGALAESINKESLSSPVVFAPEMGAPARFVDLDAGGVTTQSQADTGLAYYLELQKRNDFTLCSVVFQDPWIEIGDLTNLGPLPQEMVLIGNGVYYLFDMRAVSPDLIKWFRTRCVSFLKVIYVSSMSPAAFLETIQSGNNDQLSSYVKSAKHVAVSACDDETWIVGRLVYGDKTNVHPSG